MYDPLCFYIEETTVPFPGARLRFQQSSCALPELLNSGDVVTYTDCIRDNAI